MIAILFIGAIAINSCPGSGPGLCAATNIIEAHNTVRWNQPMEPWPCDGSVWWEVRLDDAEPPVVMRCSLTPTPGGDMIVWCPKGIAPVKYWDRVPGQSAWLSVRACNSGGCTTDCYTELIWPVYTVYP